MTLLLVQDFVEADTAAEPLGIIQISLLPFSTIFDAAADIPGILQKPGCGFYVSYEAYAFFLQALAALNTGASYNQSLDGASYLGYPVYPTSGIPNTVDVCGIHLP